MSFARFEEYLRTGSIYAARLDSFWDTALGPQADPEEGIPNLNDQDEFLEQFARLTQRTGLSKREELNRSIATIKANKLWTASKMGFAVCFRSGNTESAKAWRAYCRAGSGVLVHSHTDAVHSALADTKNTLLTPIQYIDRDSVSTNVPGRHVSVCKSLKWKWESEVRLLVYRLADYLLTEKGMVLARVNTEALFRRLGSAPTPERWAPVLELFQSLIDTGHFGAYFHDHVILQSDPAKLIRGVTTSPGTSSDWRREVKHLLRRAGVRVPVRKSRFSPYGSRDAHAPNNS